MIVTLNRVKVSWAETRSGKKKTDLAVQCGTRGVNAMVLAVPIGHIVAIAT